MSSGGSSFLDDIASFAEDTFDTSIFGKNFWAKDLVKDVTGATAAEEANKAAEQNLKEQKAAAEADRVAGQQQFAKEQLIKSKQAGGQRRSTNSSRSTATPKAVKTLATNNLGSDEQDFLGL